MALTTPMADPSVPRPGRAFIDLHCHTRGSFDSLSDPAAAMRAAQSRGLTHLAITDHDRIDVALRARDAAPSGLTIIVGSEVKTADGDLICLFLERPIAPGLPAAETIAATRDQGGLVGIPHPFDRFRGSLLNDQRARGSGRPGRLGRGLERPGHRPRRERTGRRVRARVIGLPDRGGVRCPFDARDRRRVHGRRRRPVDTGRPPDGAVVRRDRPRSGILLSHGRSPRWPSSSNEDAATDGCDRHRPTPRARGWSDDRRPDTTSGRPGRSHAGRRRPGGHGRRPRTPRRARTARGRVGAARSPGRRPGHRRPALARPPAAPAADDHLDRPADRPARPVRSSAARVQARRASSATSRPRTSRCSSRRSSSSTSASRCAACAGRS